LGKQWFSVAPLIPSVDPPGVTRRCRLCSSMRLFLSCGFALDAILVSLIRVIFFFSVVFFRHAVRHRILLPGSFLVLILSFAQFFLFRLDPGLDFDLNFDVFRPQVCLFLTDFHFSFMFLPHRSAAYIFIGGACPTAVSSEL